MILVASKIDIRGRPCDDFVTSDEAMSFAKKNNLIYLEVSAKINYNVDLIFKFLLQAIFKRNIKFKLNVPNYAYTFDDLESSLKPRLMS